MVITICSFKGGMDKSTIALNLDLVNYNGVQVGGKVLQTFVHLCDPGSGIGGRR